MNKIKKNIPNMITISRIISCICGATLFTLGNIDLAITAYIYGAVSDAMDGYLARKFNVVSEVGKKLDAISDKIFALSLLIPSIILGNYLMILPLVLEGVISSINIYANSKYHKTHTEIIGKFKTIMLFPTMILGLINIKTSNLTLAFLPSFIVTLILQTLSIKAYKEQLQIYKMEERNEKIRKECNTLDKDLSYNKEYNNINKIDNNISNNIDNTYHSNKNIKKLVRKKDYNDRY